MTHTPPDAEPLHHHIRPMRGRDPHEAHRVATPLELLFDLTFATAFSIGAAQLAHMLAEGHFAPAIIGFGFASFAICWAWINFSWFSSAYDTDDWVFRLTTMAQMIGVLILAIGLPRMFASLEAGAHVDNSIMILGYVVMRVAMLFQWLRAARQDPQRRRACLTYAVAIGIAQIGWIAQILFDWSLGATMVFVVVLGFIELAGPILAERGGGTPWHAHHIAERNSLFAIIALGEAVVGTVATLSAVVAEQGWTIDAALVGIAGMGLTFGLWWTYYMLPSGQVLHRHRERSFVWGYGQMLVVTAIVATGAGLHVAAYFIGHESHLSSVATVLCVAVPVMIFLGMIYGLYAYLVRGFDRRAGFLLLATVGVIALSIIAALLEIDMAVCLVIVMLAPVVTIIGYEVAGYRHQAKLLASDQASTA